MPIARISWVSAVVFLLISACATPIVRVAQPDSLGAGAPVIERLLDLGGMPLPDVGSLSQEHADGVLTPGEWMAVLGRGLDSGSQSRIDIDGTPVEVKGHLAGGSLLAQVPRRLAPRKSHRLQVTTPAGQASISFTVNSYVVVGDTSGKTVRFVPMAANGKTVLSPAVAELDVSEAYLHVLSPSGAWLYIVQALAQPDPQSVRSEIAVVHMGARQGPKRVATVPIQSAAWPTAVTMLDENTLLVLSERDLLVCEVAAGRGQVRGRIDLPSSAEKMLYSDVEAVAGRSAVLLEAYGNTATLVDLADLRTPRLAATLGVATVKGVPWSIDLARDPDDGNAVWLLQGPNLRISGDKLGQGAKDLLAKSKSALGIKTAASSTKTLEAAASPESYARLLRIRAEAGALQIVDQRPLPPDFSPFFVSPQPKGELLLSGVTSDVFRFAGLPRSLDGLKNAIDVLTGSLQFGRIVRLRSDGSSEVVLKGSAIYFNLDTLTDGIVLYSVIRPGFRVIPPSLQLEWGVESAGKSDNDQDYRELVSLSWTAIIPPYAFGVLSVQ